MGRFATGALIIVAVFLGVSSVASAQTVFRSSRGFNVAACPAVAPGYARCHARIVTDSAGHFLSKAPSPNVVPSGYGPAQLHSAYNTTSFGSSSTIIAIVDAYGYPNAESDLAVYRKEFGLSACTTSNGCFEKVNQSGQRGHYPPFNAGWADETALDLDMVSAMCPNCKILLVEGSSNSFNDLAVSENTAAALGAHAISNSYGGNCSGSDACSTPFNSYYNHPGIAVTVSTGDSTYNAGPEFPASSPYVTAVGGTSLYPASNARGWTESAWSGAGSGCSTVYGQPAWQSTNANIISVCPNRAAADVSAVADPATGVAVFAPYNGTKSAWLVFGGTSVAAPLTAGVYGENGGPVTYGSNPYSAPAGSLNDVTTGSNGSCGGSLICTAGPGWDGPTGLGTPNGSAAY